MIDAIERDIEMYSIDESIFHQRVVVKKTWSQPYKNVVPVHQLKCEPALAVVGAMSNKRGWLGHYVRAKSIRAVDFIEFLKQLRGESQEEKVLILDNASIHLTKSVK